MGRVVEIGFGSGLNIDFYPPNVELVLAVEPAAVARKLADKRVTQSGVAVEHIGLDGQSIPLEDDSCDSALSTFTLCTIPDAPQALAELRRVMRPGARVHFLEHGLAPDPGIAAWQRRLEPWQRRIADGCHLTRRTGGAVAPVGFHHRSCRGALRQRTEALELVQRRDRHQSPVAGRRFRPGITLTRQPVRRSCDGRRPFPSRAPDLVTCPDRRMLKPPRSDGLGSPTSRTTRTSRTS